MSNKSSFSKSHRLSMIKLANYMIREKIGFHQLLAELGGLIQLVLERKRLSKEVRKLRNEAVKATPLKRQGRHIRRRGK